MYMLYLPVNGSFVPDTSNLPKMKAVNPNGRVFILRIKVTFNLHLDVQFFTIVKTISLLLLNQSYRSLLITFALLSENGEVPAVEL